MIIELVGQACDGPHGAPSGLEYWFLPDAQGRRVAEVNYGLDQERFLSVIGLDGQPVWQALSEAKPAPKTRKPAVVEPSAPPLDGGGES